MKLLLFYFLLTSLVLLFWHLLISDQKRLKRWLFCPLCDLILKKKNALVYCSECGISHLSPDFAEICKKDQEIPEDEASVVRIEQQFEASVLETQNVNETTPDASHQGGSRDSDIILRGD